MIQRRPLYKRKAALGPIRIAAKPDPNATVTPAVITRVTPAEYKKIASAAAKLIRSPTTVTPVAHTTTTTTTSVASDKSPPPTTTGGQHRRSSFDAYSPASTIAESPFSCVNHESQGSPLSLFPSTPLRQDQPSDQVAHRRPSAVCRSVRRIDQEAHVLVARPLEEIGGTTPNSTHFSESSMSVVLGDVVMKDELLSQDATTTAATTATTIATESQCSRSKVSLRPAFDAVSVTPTTRGPGGSGRVGLAIAHLPTGKLEAMKLAIREMDSNSSQELVNQMDRLHNDRGGGGGETSNREEEEDEDEEQDVDILERELTPAKAPPTRSSARIVSQLH